MQMFLCIKGQKGMEGGWGGWGCVGATNSHLRGQGMWCSSLQQNSSGLQLTLPGRNVEGGVAVGGGSIWVSHVLQQQLDDVRFSQTGGDVKGRLVLLWREERNVAQFRARLRNLDQGHLPSPLEQWRAVVRVGGEVSTQQKKMCLFQKKNKTKHKVAMTADSLWPWHPLMLHSSADSEPPPSDRRALPCGGPSHHADINKTEQLWELRGSSSLATGASPKPGGNFMLRVSHARTHNVTDVWRRSVLEEE